MDLTPDVDYDGMLSDLPEQEHTDPEAVGEWLSWAWADAYRSRVVASGLLELDQVGTFLYDDTHDTGAPQADRTIAAWGLSRPGPRRRDVAYQRRYPSPEGRAERPLDKGHLIPHSGGGEFGPNIFPQDRALNRGWSAEGKRYRALEREIVKTAGTFFFCCLLYADHSDFPAAVELGVLRTDRLHVARFRNRFDLELGGQAIT